MTFFFKLAGFSDEFCVQQFIEENILIFKVQCPSKLSKATLLSLKIPLDKSLNINKTIKKLSPETIILHFKRTNFAESKKFNVMCDAVVILKITQFRMIQSEKRKLDVVVME